LTEEQKSFIALGIMKSQTLAALLFLGSIVLAGCGKPSPLAGRWSTTQPFGDASGMATAELVLEHQGEVISGTFTFKTLPEAAKKELGAVSFQIEQVRFGDGRLSFVVPIAPTQPKECLLFNLQLDGNQLKGTAKENNPEVDKLLPVEFRKSAPHN
jgi:hypothetical protein